MFKNFTALSLLLGLFVLSQAQEYRYDGDEIKTYEVAATGEMTFNEEIITGSVTSKFFLRIKQFVVFNQPDNNKYTVYISDSLTNQTISDIENDIVGVDDELYERFDTGVDQIRKIEVEDIQVLFVKKSLERKSRILANSLIVVVLNATETAEAGENRYSVWRYWRS